MKLVTVDLDGTLLPNTTAFAVILNDLGEGDFVSKSDEEYFAGRLSLEDCFWEQWEKISKYSPAQVYRAMRKAPWLPGIAQGVGKLHDAGYKVLLLTDQPSLAAQFVMRWGFDDAVCSQVITHDGKIASIDARFDKWENLVSVVPTVNSAQTIHIGNGENDIPIWEKCGKGIAVFAKKEVAAKASIVIENPTSFAEIVDRLLRED